MNELQQWTETIISSLIRYPEDLSVTAGTARVGIKVNRADHGKVIGKGCKNLASIKVLLEAIFDHRVELTVLEPSVGKREPPDDFLPDDRWNSKKEDALMTLLRQISVAALKDCHVHRNPSDPTQSNFVVTSKRMTMEIEQALYTIFRAIGNSRGRKVSVEGRCG